MVLSAKITLVLSVYLFSVVTEIAEILDIQVFVTKQERLKREN